MTSTSQRTCTGFVPESITGGSAAGQDSADRYKSRLVMKCITGFSGQGGSDRNRSDLHRLDPSGPTRTDADRCWVVPDLYRASRAQRISRARRKIVDALAVAAMFPPLYVLAWLIDRQDRKAGRR